ACPAEDVFTVIAEALGAGLEVRPETYPTDPDTLDRYERLVEATRLAGREQEAAELYWYGMGNYQNLGLTLGEYRRAYRILAAFDLRSDPADIAPELFRWRSSLANDLSLFAQSLGLLAEAWDVQQISTRRIKPRDTGWKIAVRLVNSMYLAYEIGR